ARRRTGRQSPDRLQRRRASPHPDPARGPRRDDRWRTSPRLPDPAGHTPLVTRYALTIEYDGRPFMGWQRQDHGPSVQQALETAIGKMTGETATVHAAGRTDAGVHALAMRAHVELARQLTPFRLM